MSENSNDDEERLSNRRSVRQRNPPDRMQPTENLRVMDRRMINPLTGSLGLRSTVVSTMSRLRKNDKAPGEIMVNNKPRRGGSRSHNVKPGNLPSSSSSGFYLPLDVGNEDEYVVPQNQHIHDDLVHASDSI
jgi:hypothetical protein